MYSSTIVSDCTHLVMQLMQSDKACSGIIQKGSKRRLEPVTVRFVCTSIFNAASMMLLFNIMLFGAC